MKLIFYANPDDEAGKRARAVVCRQISESETEICPSVENLSKRLREPGNGVSLAVLMATSPEDLTNVLALRDLLQDLRIILILPDREKETIASGLTLRPRFLTFADSDFTELSPVLGKMMRIYYKERQRWKERLN